MATALDGVKILDMSRLLPGGYCSMLLADLGCEVIKIEEPGKGDYYRDMIPGAFEGVSRNKKSVTLNLKKKQGREIFLQLSKKADVILESFRPGVVDRLGVGYNDVKSVNPEIIYCSISGYGQTGSRRNVSGHDANFQGVSGVLSISGDLEGPPAIPSGLSIADLNSSMFAAVSILAALLEKEKLGVGQYIDVSMTDVMVSWMGRYLVEYLNTGKPSKEEMFNRPGYGVFKTKDEKYITLACLEDNFWNNLVDFFGPQSELSKDSYKTLPERMKERKKIQSVLELEVIKYTQEQWLQIFHERDIPGGPVNMLDEVTHDLHLQERGLFSWLDNSDSGKSLQVRFPVKFTHLKTEIRSNPPKLGEHTEFILKEMGIIDLDLLRNEGVI